MTTTQTRPENLEVHKDYAVYGPVGVVNLGQAVNMVTAVISYVRQQGIKYLLVDFLQLKGIRVPVLAERYFVAHEWAREATQVVSLALVLEPHLIDPDRFGVVVGWNLGMRADVFTDVSSGLKWLLSGEKPLPVTGH